MKIFSFHHRKLSVPCPILCALQFIADCLPGFFLLSSCHTTLVNFSRRELIIFVYGCHVCLLFPFITPFLLCLDKKSFRVIYRLWFSFWTSGFFSLVTFWLFYASVWSTWETIQWSWDENQGQNSSPCLWSASDSGSGFRSISTLFSPLFHGPGFLSAVSKPNSLCSWPWSLIFSHLQDFHLVVGCILSTQWDFPVSLKRPGLL